MRGTSLKIGLTIIGLAAILLAPAIVHSLTVKPLFNSVNPGSAVVWEGVMGNHYYTKAGTIAYAIYDPGNPSASSYGYLVMMVDKEGYGYIVPRYVQTPILHADNVFAIYAKWYHRNMNTNDLHRIELDGWALEVDDVSRNPIQVSFSVSAGSGGTQGSFSVSLQDMSGSEGYPANSLVSGSWHPYVSDDTVWLYLGYASNYKVSWAPWNWDNEYYTRSIAYFTWDNDYMQQNNGNIILLGAKIKVE